VIKKSLYAILILLAAVSFTAGYLVAANPDPGSVQDPLVTQSYVESYVQSYLNTYLSNENNNQQQKIAELEKKIELLEEDLKKLESEKTQDRQNNSSNSTPEDNNGRQISGSVKITAVKANLRQSPSLTASVVRVALKNETFKVKSKKGEWYEVMDKNKSVYIHQSVCVYIQ